jgi:hypothetical protein
MGTPNSIEEPRYCRQVAQHARHGTAGVVEARKPRIGIGAAQAAALHRQVRAQRSNAITLVDRLLKFETPRFCLLRAFNMWCHWCRVTGGRHRSAPSSGANR